MGCSVDPLFLFYFLDLILYFLAKGMGLYLRGQENKVFEIDSSPLEIFKQRVGRYLLEMLLEDHLLHAVGWTR